MKKLLTLILPVIVMAAVAASLPVAVAFAAQDPGASKALCEGSGGQWVDATSTCQGQNGEQSFPAALASITNLLLFIIGAIAVIVIIVGGIRYVTSSGDQTAVTNAKNTILYAVIGIIVAFIAYAIVNFITGQFS